MSSAIAQDELPPASAPTDVAKVAYFVHCFGVGGMERCVARLANGLDPRRFSACVIVLTEDEGAGQWLADHVEVHELHKPLGNNFSTLGKLTELLQKQRIDVLHSHNWGTLVESVIARKRARVAAHVHAERGTVLDDLGLRSWKQWLRGRVAKWGMSRADQVIAVSTATRQSIERLCGFPSERVAVIGNGVEPVAGTDEAAIEAMRHRSRNELGLSRDAVLVSSVGRLAPVKNFALLVEAMRAVVDRQPRAHLALVGDGSERTALERRVAELGLSDHVTFVGHCDEVAPWYAASDIYVNSSVSEGMSQSLLEAMSVGVPLVVTDVGDHADVAAGDVSCGEVVPSEDVAAMSAAIAKLTGDDALRSECGANSLQRFRADYNAAAMIRKYERHYLRALGRGED